MKHKRVLLQSQLWYGSVLCVCASSGQDQLTPDEGRKRNALLMLLLKFLIVGSLEQIHKYKLHYIFSSDYIPLFAFSWCVKAGCHS